MIIDPNRFEGFRYVFMGVVVPRPIAFVSSMSSDGLVNLAPYSFFNAVSSSPPTIVFSAGRQAGDKLKDTLANVEETGEFVINVVVDDIAKAMSLTAAEYPAQVNEFEIAGLTPIPSQIVKPPRVAESPVNLECRLKQIVNIGNGPGQVGLVIGEVLLMHVRDDVIDGHRIDQQRLRAVGRLAGNMYCHTIDTYELVPPVYTPEPGLLG